MIMDFGFGVGFRWQRWVYVWVSTATVGLALRFNSAGGGFCFGSPFGLVWDFFFFFVSEIFFLCCKVWSGI